MLGDEEDKKYLFSLTEVEREKIISERYNKRKELQERRRLKKKLKSEQDSEQPTSRTPVKKNKRASALSDLKRKRARVQSIQESSESSESSEQEKDDSDRELVTKDNEEPKSESPSRSDIHAKTDSEADRITVEDIQSICLRRIQLEDIHFQPYFKDLAPGMFVRIMIGQYEGKPVYRLCRIEEVRESANKFYPLGTKKTNKYLFVSHATNKKQFSMDQVSNHSITQTEFTKWLMEMERNEIPIPTKSEVKEVSQKLSERNKFIYTEEIVSKMVPKGNDRLTLSSKKSYLLTQKKELINLGQINTEEYRLICSEIEELEKVLGINTKENSLDKTALINMKNRQANRSMVYDNTSIKSENDAFSRHQTRAKNIVFTNIEEIQNDLIEKEIPKEPSKEKKVQAQTPIEPKIEKIEFINPDNALKEAHNFDLNLGVSATPKVKVEKNLLPVVSDIPKLEENPKQTRSISVNDYKRRRGLL